MPSIARLERLAQRPANQYKLCPHCGKSSSTYKGAWKYHEKKCNRRASENLNVPRATSPSSSESGASIASSSDAETTQSSWRDYRDTGNDLHNVDPSGLDGGVEDAIPELDDAQVWVRRHPASKTPSGLLDATLQATKHNTSMERLKRLTPWFPFCTLNDFIQAEIFIEFGATDSHINRQLAHSSKSTMQDAKELHKTLAIASSLWGEFVTAPVITEFDGKRFEHFVHYQPVLPALTQVLADPDLARYMVFYPEQRYVNRPGANGGSMQVLEELWHGKTWWDMQSEIAPHQVILYLVIYIDETNVSTIGGVKVWPVYLWIGNLPASIRKRRGQKGGAILIAYLPKAQKNEPVSDLALFRCQVYHDALAVVFESLKLATRHGVPLWCGDGVIRDFVPTIAAGSADYMEFIRIVCILGQKSGFPCPICLVPRESQWDLSQSWPMRTVSSTQAVQERAELAFTAAERDKILREQSLRSTKSVFIDLIPPFHSIYAAVVADPLHQIEQGIWGKHLWPWIRDGLSQAQQDTLDARFKSIQRYPDLKHFPNGITTLKNLTGKEHAIILKMIPPLIEGLINKKYRKLILGVFRTLAEIHTMAKFTTHTEATLEELDQLIEEFNRLHKSLADTFTDVKTSYPKFHSLSHLTDIIVRHSTTDNYHTGLGEALHPQSKKDYRRSNRQLNFEIQMLHMHQEREAIIRIRAQINSTKSSLDDEPDKTSWDGPRVQFGSPDRQGRQLATSFVKDHTRRDPGAKGMEMHLRTFLYQRIRGFGGNRIHFKRSDLPVLDGMMVSFYQLVTIGYDSVLDSQSGLDVARVTNSWRNQGPRHDHVIADDGKGLFVARLLRLFKLEARGQQYFLAYVHRLKIQRRNRNTGYIDLKDQSVRNFIFADWILRSCVVLSPGIEAKKHALMDLESSDMYYRLQDLP